MWRMVPEIWSTTDIMFCPSPFFVLLPPEEIIILQMHAINDSHMMYGSWDMECNRQNFLSSRTVFLPFYPLWTQKIKTLKKWKHHLEILSFYTSVKWQSYYVWFLRYQAQQTAFFVILDHFLPSPPPPPPTAPKMKNMGVYIGSKSNNHNKGS